MELLAGGDGSIFLPHVPHVWNRGANPMVDGLFQLDGHLLLARHAPMKVWKHLVAEVPQDARFLGVHDGRSARLCLISEHH